MRACFHWRKEILLDLDGGEWDHGIGFVLLEDGVPFVLGLAEALLIPLFNLAGSMMHS